MKEKEIRRIFIFLVNNDFISDYDIIPARLDDIDKK
jgi:hypothetical protein